MAFMNASQQLVTERNVFERNYEQFASKHLGEVVLICGNKILGFFKTAQKAEETAYRQYNLFGKHFLIRPILTPEQEKREEIYQRLNLSELA